MVSSCVKSNHSNHNHRATCHALSSSGVNLHAWHTPPCRSSLLHAGKPLTNTTQRCAVPKQRSNTGQLLPGAAHLLAQGRPRSPGGRPPWAVVLGCRAGRAGRGWRRTPALCQRHRLHAHLRVSLLQGPELVVSSCLKSKQPQPHSNLPRPTHQVSSCMRGILRPVVPHCCVLESPSPTQPKDVRFHSSAQTQGKWCQEQLTSWRQVGRGRQAGSGLGRCWCWEVGRGGPGRDGVACWRCAGGSACTHTSG